MKLTLTLLLLSTCTVDKDPIPCHDRTVGTNPAAIQLNIGCREF